MKSMNSYPIDQELGVLNPDEELIEVMMDHGEQ